ncbi:hypothetical protein PR048_017117 [Dryococelus australis]|uniref:Uncharacterized protein n=1 Tax=Dryococelus australis TaxID=614101 RepID=A0ABQ9H8N8_9NEOP|nr:hypothetical protein PR048_017117 [Dryococelus australis]
MLKSINLSDLIKDDTQPNEDNNADYDTNDGVFQECDNVVSVEGLRHIANIENYILTCVSPEEITENDWINTVTRREPSKRIPKMLQLAEQLFHKVHGELFSNENDIINLVTEAVIEKSNKIPRGVIYHYVKTRIYIHIKVINKQLASSFNAIRGKLLKKIKKF